ncbi:MAG: disA [Acidimicrobiaceae bacterium]|nr:disA [Acidimicrobiaceae bacterium]
MADLDSDLADRLAQVVPGSLLREGLERILGARMGALVILGDGPEVLGICSGGFHIDAEMSPQRLSELAKMDGAIVLSEDARRIAWANVHLIPDPAAQTTETGTRHRTAERVARSVNISVVAVSEENSTITVYRGAFRHQLQDTDSLIGRANHLLQTLQRFIDRLEVVDRALDRCELDETVTLNEVITVLQRAEMAMRVARAIARLVTELGSQGRLLRLQLQELVTMATGDRRMVLADYVRPLSNGQELEDAIESALSCLASVPTEQLLDLQHLATAMAGPGLFGELVAGDLTARITPRGRRLLRRLPHPLPDGVVDELVGRYGDLFGLRRATLEELAVTAGEEEANELRRGIDRLERVRGERRP